MKFEFDEIVKHLTIKERSEVKHEKINSIDGLIYLLVDRVPQDNLPELARLFKQSVIPSIYSEEDTEADRLFIKIEANPKLLLDKEVQDKIEELIIKRFEKDKQIVIEKTSDISKFVILMEEYLNDAISSSGNGSKNVLTIKEKIQSINLDKNGVQALSKLQKELVHAASSIEKEMNTVNKKLVSGKTKVQELEEKVALLEEELSKSKTESMKDHLTGLLTRRAFEEEIKRIESSYQRNNAQYAIVFFDIDHFKKVNDTYGHDGGDVILSTFAKVLDKNTRDYDIVGRYGGEEFIAIVHFNLNRELLQYLKRIKTIVTSNSFVYKNKKVKVTFSAGVAIRSNYTSYENTLQKADMLLYEAKDTGRNQIKLEDGRTV